MARWVGWLAAALILAAGLVPVLHRLREKRRAPFGAPSIRLHIALGQAAAAASFLHTLLALTALGSQAAMGGGTLALAPGAAAFMVLVAHAGIGLQLSKDKLRDRAGKRRTHVITAVSITVVVGVHAGILIAVR